ncbi:hypothetical protein, partial [Terasakiella sp.]|uniref:hypothetical protein n=1 Tax=Terasakiella sp. TaxID=2034861 RepID=UPI003AA9BF40
NFANGALITLSVAQYAPHCTISDKTFSYKKRGDTPEMYRLIIFNYFTKATILNHTGLHSPQ